MASAAVPGPPVAELVNRLASCPADFLAPPRVGSRGVVSVAAVLGDVVRGLGGELPDAWEEALAPREADEAGENWLQACLVTGWLAAAPALRDRLGPRLLGFLADDLHRTAALVRAERLVNDPDRREELCRLLLRAAGLVPAGESAAQAADRLATLDSAHRARVEAEARAAEERSREVRDALARRRAEEAAARASRE